MTDLSKLDQAIRAVCPINGISIGKKGDKSTWKLQFCTSATDEQKIEASKVIAAFNLEDQATLTVVDSIISDVEQLQKLKAALNSAPAQMATG